MPKKIVLSLLLITLITGLIAGLLGCGQPEALREAAPLAHYMPPETTLFLSVKLRPEGQAVENWRRIREAMVQIPAVKEGLNEMATEAQEMPFDWKQDIEPWLGQTMAIGVIDLDSLWEAMRQQAAGNADVEPAPPPFLAAIDIQDREAFDRFVDLLRQELEADGLSLGERPYEGTTIYNVPLEGEEMELFFAVHDDRVLLVADERALIEDALGREEGDSLASEEAFLSIIERLPPEGLALGYVAYGRLNAGMQEALAEVGEVPLPENLGAGIRSAGFAFLAEEEGLRLVTEAEIDTAALAEAGLKSFYDKVRQPLPGRAMELIPRATALTMVGQNLQAYWEMQTTQMKETSPEAYADLQGTLEDLAVETGIDLEEDVLSWMTGEFAIFVAPGEELGTRTALGLPTLRAGFLFEVGDRGKAERLMEKVEALVKEQADFPATFDTEEIEGVEVRVLPTLEQAGYLPGYAFVGDFLLIGIDEASFRAAIRASQDKGDRLAASPEFAAVQERLPEENSGLFFLDMAALNDFLEASLEEPELGDFQAQVKPFLDLMGGMGMAGTMKEEHSSATMFLHVVR